MKLYPLAAILILLSCESQKSAAETTDDIKSLEPHIGLISHDPKLDTMDFMLCDENRTYPYFHHQDVSYKGEKRAIINTYDSLFKPVNSTEQGFVTIRFVVNCRGEAGRYRIIQLDQDYQETTFNDEIINQLYTITINLDEWDILEREGDSYDYVRYLTFKIQNGAIASILP